MDDKFKEENYISLSDATKYCDYSQEYLSLRVRQGKLKGLKLGRNWVTTKEWLNEYIESCKESFNGKYKKAESEEPEKEKIVFAKEPPTELPFGQFSEPVQNLFLQREKPKVSNLNFLVLFLGALAISLGVLYLEKDSVGDFYYESSITAKNVLKISTDKILGEKGKVFAINSFMELKDISKDVLEKSKSEISNNLVSLKISSYFNEAENIFKKYWAKAKINLLAAKEKTLNVFKNFTSMFFERKKDLAKKEDKQLEFLKSVKKGMVVVPEEKDRELVKEKIKGYFSDQVEVVPKDDQSGIIIPVFKERKGEEYLYMLVPTKVK